MRKIFIMRILVFILCFFSGIYGHAQDIVGSWYGQLKVQGTTLSLVIHVKKTNNGYSGTMDSPDQGAKGIPLTETTFSDSLFGFRQKAAGLSYSGVLKENEIEGTFKQGGFSLPLTLSRTLIEKTIPKRPQEPKPPFPYYTEEVSFINASAGISLSGTLSLPAKEGAYPVVVLISGSGPQNRDEEILDHKPFLVLSDFLTRQGIGVLRYDDRGVGKSGGTFSAATSADFAGDAMAAVNFLKSRKENVSSIGLIGHSEGGLIAPMVANKTKDVDFIVMLAGPALRGDKILLLQQQLISRTNGISDSAVEKNRKLMEGVYAKMTSAKSALDAEKALTAFFETELKNDTSARIPEGTSQGDFIAMQVKNLVNEWMLYFVKYDPAPALQRLKVPALALFGEKDLQVPPKENSAAIKKIMKRNSRISLLELPGLNHLFQESATGSPSEYGNIEQTFSPDAMKTVLNFILRQNGKAGKTE